MHETSNYTFPTTSYILLPTPMVLIHKQPNVDSDILNNILRHIASFFLLSNLNSLKKNSLDSFHNAVRDIRAQQSCYLMHPNSIV